MHRTISLSHLGTAVCLGVWLCTQLTAPVAAQDRVRAKVGIQVRSGERNTSAQATETVKAGDFLRVYVVPEDDAYVYVVSNDGKAPRLLNSQDAHTKVPKRSLATWPAPDDFYQIDGASDKESITVICSPTEIREVATLFRTPNVSQQNWTSLEKQLIEKSKIDLAQKTDKPFQIMGNVRGLDPLARLDPFLDTLQIFSGRALVVKKYDFQVRIRDDFQGRIRAKLGIKIRSGEQSTAAKSTETAAKSTEIVKAGDFLRVYVGPEVDAYVYVVSNDGKAPVLLNMQNADTKVQQRSLVTLPGPAGFYQIDGTRDKIDGTHDTNWILPFPYDPKSSNFTITVICSPTKIGEVATLFRTTNVSQNNWTSLEKELTEKSKIDLAQKADEPFQIIGNVRDLDLFVDNLQIFSGRALVVKKYDFQVQK